MLVTALAFVGLTFQQAQSVIKLDLPAKYQVARPAPDAVVGRVNGTVIRARDVEDLLWQWRGSEAVTELIEYELVRAAAAKAEVTATEAEIDDRLERSIKELEPSLQGRPVDEALLAMGFTRSRAYLRVRADVLLEKMALKSFRPEDFIKVSAITVTPGNGITLEGAIQAADEAYAKLKAGSEWRDVLATTTPDERILQSGGLVGWRRLRLFPESVAKEIATLKPGSYTKPAQTTSGVQIFRIEAKPSEATPEQMNELRQTYLAAETAMIRQRLRNEAKIENFRPTAPKPPAG